MKIGLIGLPQTGKTTIFDLLTNTPDDTIGKAKRQDAHIGTAIVPDTRIDFLSAIYKPKKTTYATIEVTDIKGIISAEAVAKANGPDPFLESVRQVDALVHVVRAFRNDTVMHAEGSIMPVRDIETVNLELLFADLGIVENRIDRIQHSKKITTEMQMELEVLKKCRAVLEKEKPLSSINFEEDEKQLLKTFKFLTEKPQVLLINLDEEQFKSGSYMQKDDIRKYAQPKGIPVIDLCAEVELEISRLNEEDRILFMEDFGIKEPGISKLSSAMYSYLGLISFLTVGEDEVRAWPVRKGTNSRNASGKVHSDIERGFIRAETVKFDDLVKHGTMHKIKEKGLFRLEGKDYIVEDGDIINFRFNI